ncbi:MAG: hypothetical protein JL50_02940 [Peptococcaceae bacterium BICA1-7]|nr:MAG: hypothetical protein JL50_02940 [Peptococcaceae bacterium BICA1-7]HBV97779.1 hypothetical protein [Desulfotomaculum sp.]
MATTLAVQSVAATGLNPSFTAADATGNNFPNAAGGKTFLAVKNGSVGSVTVTVNSQTECDQGFDHDLDVAVPAGQERWIGPFAQKRFNDGAGLVSVTYSAVADVTVAAISI